MLSLCVFGVLFMHYMFLCTYKSVLFSFQFLFLINIYLHWRYVYLLICTYTLLFMAMHYDVKERSLLYKDIDNCFVYKNIKNI